MPRQVTGFNLPEGMTAEKLRELADDPVANKVHAALHAWADAIDPPKPEPVVTDEMVEAVARVLVLDPERPGWSVVMRSTLEAAVKCGWAPPQDSAEKLTERLEMAEGLLRRAHYVGFHFGGGDAIWCIDKSWGEVHVDVTAHEAEYLWSLFGEGEGDE